MARKRRRPEGITGGKGAECWGCSTAQVSGTCANSRTISTPQLESRVLGALRDRLLRPELVEIFIDKYRRTREEDRTTAAAARAKVERSRAKVTGRIERLSDMMVDGIGDNAEMKARLKAALAERAEIHYQIEEVRLRSRCIPRWRKHIAATLRN